jgi:predicted metal-binding transcription factor (methanogenesis marker protein 9)
LEKKHLIIIGRAALIFYIKMHCECVREQFTTENYVHIKKIVLNSTKLFFVGSRFWCSKHIFKKCQCRALMFKLNLTGKSLLRTKLKVARRFVYILIMWKFWIFTVEYPSIQYKRFNEQKIVVMYKNYEWISSEPRNMNFEEWWFIFCGPILSINENFLSLLE